MQNSYFANFPVLECIFCTTKTPNRVKLINQLISESLNQSKLIIYCAPSCEWIWDQRHMFSTVLIFM